MAQKYPHLLKVEEKYDDSFYVIENIEDFTKVAYKLLKERSDLGYYYPSVEDVGKDLDGDVNGVRAEYNADLLELSDSEVSSLPESLREKAEADRAEFAYRSAQIRTISEESGDLWFAKNLELILSLPVSEALAYTYERRGRQLNMVRDLLYFRSDYQYEGYSFLDIKNVPVF